MHFIMCLEIYTVASGFDAAAIVQEMWFVLVFEATAIVAGDMVCFGV